ASTLLPSTPLFRSAAGRPGRRRGARARRRRGGHRRRGRPGRPRGRRGDRPGRRHRAEQRRVPTGLPGGGVPSGGVLPDAAGDGGGAVPHRPGRPAAHVPAEVGPDRERLLGARAARLALQVGLRHRQARPGGPVQGGRGRGGRPGRDVQLRLPRLRAHPAGRGPARRPGGSARPGPRRGRRAGAARPHPGQAAAGAGGGRRGRRLPVRPRRLVRQRYLAHPRRRLECRLNRSVPPPDPAGPESAQTQFLRLLLRDAPAVEYERPLMEARAAGWDAEALAGLETAKVLALEVRTVLADRRRRESELAALYETANDLAGMRDLDRVLRAIVDRARNLLGTDTAYLTLRDPEAGEAGRTVMRVTSGSVSARFQRD